MIVKWKCLFTKIPEFNLSLLLSFGKLSTISCKCFYEVIRSRVGQIQSDAIGSVSTNADLEREK